MAALPSLDVGVIGLGNIGRYHADSFQRLGQTIAGGVDTSDEARESFASDYNTQAFATFEELVEHGIDCLLIATPNRYHEQYAVAALERDIPVLVEKPLAHSVESAERIVAAADNSNAFCMVGFHKRFINGIEALKDRIVAHELGDLHYIEANYIRRRGIPARGGWFTHDAAAGGGALIDIGVHVLDLAVYFLDFPPIESVNASIRTEFGVREDYTYLEMHGRDEGPDRYDVEDSVRAFIRTADGTTISLNAAWAVNQPDDTTLTVTGAEGGAKIDHYSGDLELYADAHAREPQLLTTQVETRNEDPHRKEQETFLQGVVDGQAPDQNTVEQGYYVQQVVEAIYAAGEDQDVQAPAPAPTSGPDGSDQ